MILWPLNSRSIEINIYNLEGKLVENILSGSKNFEFTDYLGILPLMHLKFILFS